MQKRTRKLIRFDIQLRVVLISLCVASLVLLMNFQLSVAAVERTKGNFAVGTSPHLALEGLRNLLISKFLLSIGFSIPMAVGMGILYSFRFAGPIFRFSQYFQSLKTGRWDQRCSVRQGDDLQDLCIAINQGMHPVREFLAENKRLLQDLKSMVTKGSFPPRKVPKGT